MALKRWSDSEKALLRSKWDLPTIADIVRLLPGRDRASISNQAGRMGLPSRRPELARPDTRGTPSRGVAVPLPPGARTLPLLPSEGG